MNRDWLEDCAEGRDIFFFFVAAGCYQQGNYVSRACVTELGGATTQNEKLGKVGKIISKSWGCISKLHLPDPHLLFRDGVVACTSFQSWNVFAIQVIGWEVWVWLESATERRC